MPAKIVRREDSKTEHYRQVESQGRQYQVRIRPVRDHNGVLFGYSPSFEPLLPISGSLDRAERAVLRAIEQITGAIPVYKEPLDESR